MSYIHALGIVSAIAGILLCTLLPFLPGRYDILALPLSAMGQVFGFVGLLLVPVGALWLASHYSQRLAARQRGYAIAALVVWSIVSLIVLLAGLAFGSFSIAAIGLAVWAYVIVFAVRGVKRMKSAPPTRAARALPWYLVVVPIVVFAAQRALAGAAVEFSLGRAIRNSAPLIADIEQYRATRGHYPPSMLSSNADYLPMVMGISYYRYEPSGEAYNVVFEQLTFELSARVFVVYNPRDEQVMTSHDSDLLRQSPAGLAMRRGYFSVHDTPYQHWKMFLFD